MKLLLLQPPVQDFYDTDVRLQPIGLAYLKAAVRKHLPNIRVVVRDYHHGHGRRTLPLPPELRDLRDYYAADDKSPFSSFFHYFHFGADFETIAEEAAKERPDLIGLSSLFSPYYREVLRCAAAIKKRIHVPILLGGPHVSAMPEFMLSHPEVDFVIRGEGERPLVELLRALGRRKGLDRVPGLGFKKKGALHLNPEGRPYSVRALRVPDLSDLPRERYLFEGRPLCFIITSRGCPYRCSFCSVHRTFGHAYRERSARDILGEMKQRYREGYRVFDFEDDNFTLNKKRTTALCKKIIRSFPKKDVRLTAMNGVCYWTLDDEVLGTMREAGFTHLNLSLVSSNQALLRKLRRPLWTEKYAAVVTKAAALGFKTVAYQILGLPGETVLSMVRTLRLNAKLPVLLGASPFYLTPGAPVAATFGPLSEADIFKARLTALAIANPVADRGDIYTLFITTRILNFLKGIEFEHPAVPLEKALRIARVRDERSHTGVMLLRKLLHQKRLFAMTPAGRVPLPRFKPELFFKVWGELDRIMTQQNRTILIH
ncbi:MAG: B12-binding domain-containing radical SAM protein [Candidatus Omnitrophica bacterium]|nr:B12-binding domain-containing radical SAM protein [Candidatus Omnitrophota bacterium]